MMRVKKIRVVGEVVPPQISEINEIQKNAGGNTALICQAFLSRLPREVL